MYVQVDPRDDATTYLGYQFGNYTRIAASGDRHRVKPRNGLLEPPLRYNWATPSQQSRYAFRRPNMEHYENGNAREIVKLQIMCGDNMGGEACFGDHVGEQLRAAPA